MAQTHKIGKHCTTVKTTKDNKLSVVYHSTEVVLADLSGARRTVVLDTGGHKTLTTKTRMNQASNEYGLSYNVYQRKGRWYVNLADGTVLPFDGPRMEFVV